MTSNSSSPDVPPFHGYVDNTLHALRLIHAARQGVIPRITRRLNDTERRTMIKSGAVFVFSVEESGIKRWTDGMLWSPSRIVGNFLVYREINERASSRGNHRKSYASEDTSRGLSLHRNSSSQASPSYKASSSASTADQGTFKPNGLIKKTITVTIEGSDLHLISYYTSDDIRAGRLKKPTSRLDIMSLYMSPHLFRLTNFRVPPKVEIGPDGKPRFAVEPEDNVEVKVEEQSYSPSSSPTSIGGGSPVESSYTGSSLYPPLNVNYMRTGGGDRWGEDMRVSTPARPSTAMSMSSSPSIPYSGLSNRREITQGEAWSSLQTPARWQNDSYEAVGQTSSSFYSMDRSRIRSTQYQSPVPRDADAGRYPSSLIRSRDVSHRSPWLHDPGDRDPRPHSRASYGHSGMHYTMDGYHYNGGWASNESSSSGIASPQASFPSHSSLGSFDHSYGESAKLPALETYGTSTDEYADS